MRPDPDHRARLAAAHRALADMFDADAVNVMTHGKMMFIRSSDLGPERTSALKAVMDDMDIDVARPTDPQDIESPWVAHWFGIFLGMQIVIVDGLAEPGKTPGGTE